jgi:hypothetical protein
MNPVLGQRSCDSSALKVGESYAEKRKSFASRAEAEAWLDRQD